MIKALVISLLLETRHQHEVVMFEFFLTPVVYVTTFDFYFLISLLTFVGKPYLVLRSEGKQNDGKKIIK